MKSLAFGLAAFFIATKLLVRWWWFRPAYVRPGFIRHNEALRVYDFCAVLALIAMFFIMINTLDLPVTLIATVVLLAYDFILRAFFLRKEAKRMCATSTKWKYRDARRHVRRRASGTSAM